MNYSDIYNLQQTK